ncbi:hypothetical protein BC830DRAFT_541986 [Chytriomyces sp. MP71]|nr:hypothetical protein BC830DRAFT_541986 [Chytriomyces sp. MP71]
MQDNLTWSPSRVFGAFVLYRQIEVLKTGAEPKPTFKFASKRVQSHIAALEPTFDRSLKPNTQLVEGGLTKRTMSVVGADGRKYRLISYYNPEDVIAMFERGGEAGMEFDGVGEVFGRPMHCRDLREFLVERVNIEATSVLESSVSSIAAKGKDDRRPIANRPSTPADPTAPKRKRHSPHEDTDPCQPIPIGVPSVLRPRHPHFQQQQSHHIRTTPHQNSYLPETGALPLDREPRNYPTTYPRVYYHQRCIPYHASPLQQGPGQHYEIGQYRTPYNTLPQLQHHHHPFHGPQHQDHNARMQPPIHLSSQRLSSYPSSATVYAVNAPRPSQSLDIRPLASSLSRPPPDPLAGNHFEHPFHSMNFSHPAKLEGNATGQGENVGEETW